MTARKTTKSRRSKQALPLAIVLQCLGLMSLFTLLASFHSEPSIQNVVCEGGECHGSIIKMHNRKLVVNNNNNNNNNHERATTDITTILNNNVVPEQISFAAAKDNDEARIERSTKKKGLQYRTKTPLEPPFFIIQLGSMRSASTFQYQLLQTLVHWKSPPGAAFANHPKSSSVKYIPDDLKTNKSFVLKRHNLSSLKETIENMTDPTEANGKIAMFTSGDVPVRQIESSLHHQSRKSVVNCSLCEIDYYKPIFGLTDDEVVVLKKHFSMWEKLRQCCGLQSSKYHRLALHGCDTAPYRHLSDYPWCERQNMKHIESSFAKSPIPFFPNDPKYNWAKPGDCDRFDAIIQKGKDFNGDEFENCETFVEEWFDES